MTEPVANLAELLSFAADATVAIVDRATDPPTSITYGELRRDVMALAGALVAQGLRWGDRVGILADNTADYYRVFFAVPAAGGVTVPLNTKLPGDQQAFIAQDAALVLVFCDETNRPKSPPGVDQVLFGSTAWQNLLGGPSLSSAAAVTSQDCAVHLYTSGSTGRPKGVLLAHRAIVWTCTNYGGVPVQPVILVSAPLYHKNALMASKLCFTGGGTVVLLPRFSPAGYVDAIEQQHVTMCSGVPTMYALMTAYLTETGRQPDLSSVKATLIGSAPLTEALLDRVASLFPQAVVTNGYGTTEAVLAFTGTHPKGLTRPKISVGVAHPSVELRLVDAAGNDEDEGELWIRSPGVMNGYHNLDDVTATRLTDGWYHTGDQMRCDTDGWYFFVGRVDDMFVCAGENIYPDAVEQMLERHPGVHQAVVVPVEDELKGALPVAFVRRRPGAEVTEAELRQFALDNGAAYAHPRAVWFIDEVPLASTNKIDRLRLVRDAAARYLPRTR